MIRKAMQCDSVSENGQSMVEYGLIIAMIVIVTFIVMSIGFGPAVLEMFGNIVTQTNAVS